MTTAVLLPPTDDLDRVAPVETRRPLRRSLPSAPGRILLLIPAHEAGDKQHGLTAAMWQPIPGEDGMVAKSPVLHHGTALEPDRR